MQQDLINQVKELLDRCDDLVLLDLVHQLLLKSV